MGKAKKGNQNKEVAKSSASGARPAPSEGVNPAASNRRREILEAALELLSEHGYAGASLRKVAARVHIAQPSLYHYFKTKEDLVEQVLATFAGDMFTIMDPDGIPRRLEDVPRFCVDSVFHVYTRPTHAPFVRVAFAVSRMNPRFATLMRTIFLEQATLGFRMLVRPFVQAGEIGEREGEYLCRLCINAIGLRIMEECVLFDRKEPGEVSRDYGDFVIAAGEAYVRSLREAA